MFTSASGGFRLRQATSDLRYQVRSVPLAAVRRIGAGLGARADGGDIQARLRWYFEGKLPLANLRDDRPALGAVLMASALPDDDFEPFLAATVLLLLDRLTSDGKADNAFWNWKRHAPHYRLARPAVRAAIMCGFREARDLGRVALSASPEPGDCLTAPRDEVLEALASWAGHRVVGRLRDALLDDGAPAAAGAFWATHHGAIAALPDGPRRAALAGVRYLYERPASLVLPAGAEAPVIPVDD